MTNVVQAAAIQVVAKIQTTTGPHGGKAWILTLECGLAVRSIPKFRFARRLQLAPKRAKCRVCADRPKR